MDFAAYYIDFNRCSRNRKKENTNGFSRENDKLHSNIH